MRVYAFKRQHTGRSETGRHVDGRNTKTADETGNGKAKMEETAKSTVSAV